MRHVRREARLMKLPALAPCRVRCDRLHAAANEFDESVHSSHAKRISVKMDPDRLALQKEAARALRNPLPATSG
jgi:hypothetical protein